MRYHTFAGVGFAFLAFGLSGPAVAESLVSISYTVTGGSFTGFNLNGTITGGSLLYTPPNESVATPFSCTTITAPSCGSVQLTLTGPAGTFMGSFSPLVSMNVYPSNVIGSGYEGSANSGPDPAVSAYLFIQYDSQLKFGFLSGEIYTGSSFPYPFSHSFTLGQEVRTAPEPLPGMAQLGAGIGILGILGVRTGMAIRARRRLDCALDAADRG